MANHDKWECATCIGLNERTTAICLCCGSLALNANIGCGVSATAVHGEPTQCPGSNGPVNIYAGFGCCNRRSPLFTHWVATKVGYNLARKVPTQSTGTWKKYCGGTLSVKRHFICYTISRDDEYVIKREYLHAFDYFLKLHADDSINRMFFLISNKNYLKFIIKLYWWLKL